MRDPYAVLGVTPTVSDGDLARAVRALLVQHHPDRFAKNPTAQAAAEEFTRQVNQAHQAIVAARARPPASTRGADLTTRIKIPLEVALRGGPYDVTLDLEVGTRRLRLTIPVACDKEPPVWNKPGQGGPGEPPGDLLILSEIDPGRWTVTGNDLVMVQRVRAVDLYLARPVSIQTPWSTVSITLPRPEAGVVNLRRQRLAGYGVRRPGERRGDLFVDFELALPSADQQLEAVLRRLQPAVPPV